MVIRYRKMLTIREKLKTLSCSIVMIKHFNQHMVKTSNSWSANFAWLWWRVFFQVCIILKNGLLDCQDDEQKYRCANYLITTSNRYWNMNIPSMLGLSLVSHLTSVPINIDNLPLSGPPRRQIKKECPLHIYSAPCMKCIASLQWGTTQQTN